MQCPPPLESANYLETETFLRNKHEIAFFEIKCTFFGRKENTIRGEIVLKTLLAKTLWRYINGFLYHIQHISSKKQKKIL